VHGSGTLHTGNKPDYSLEGQFEKLSPAEVGKSCSGVHWSGGELDADGKVELSGFTDKDLTASAKGTLHSRGGMGDERAGGGWAVAAAAMRLKAGPLNAGPGIRRLPTARLRSSRTRCGSACASGNWKAR